MGAGQPPVVFAATDACTEAYPVNPIVMTSVDTYYFLMKILNGAMVGDSTRLSTFYRVAEEATLYLKATGCLTDSTQCVYFSDEVAPSTKKNTIASRNKNFGAVAMPAGLVGSAASVDDIHARFLDVVRTKSCGDIMITLGQAGEFLRVTRPAFREIVIRAARNSYHVRGVLFADDAMRMEGELAAVRFALNFATKRVASASDNAAPFSVVVASADTDVVLIAMANYEEIMRLPPDTVYWYNLYMGAPRECTGGGAPGPLPFVNLSALCRRYTAAHARAFVMMCLTTGTDYTIPIVGAVQPDQRKMFLAFLYGEKSAIALITDRLKDKKTTWIRDGELFYNRLRWIYAYYQCRDACDMPKPLDFGWDVDDPRDAQFAAERLADKEKKVKAVADKPANAATDTPAPENATVLELPATDSPVPATRQPGRRGRTPGAVSGSTQKKAKTNTGEPAIVITPVIADACADSVAEPVPVTSGPSESN